MRKSHSERLPPAVRPPLLGLRAFVAVVEHSSMSSAAEELGVTVSAVSHQVSSLEEALGAKLFERGTRPVRLTALGRQYAERLTPAFEQINLATAQLFRKRLPLEVRFTTYPLLAVKWVLPRLHRFHLANPSIELILSSTNRVLDLAVGEADVAVRSAPGGWGGCKSTAFMSDEAVAVYSPRLLNGRRRTASLLKDQTLIVYEPSGRLWRTWLRRHGVSGVNPSMGQFFDDALAAVEAAIAGAGIALAPRCTVEDDLKAGRLCEWVPSAQRLTINHYVVVSDLASDRPAVQELVRWLSAEGRLSPS